MSSKQIIVLFEVKPTKEGKARYLELASSLKPLLAEFDEFIKMERFESLNEEGKLLSMSVWESEEAVARWRNTLEHRMSQKEGKEKLFTHYQITLCTPLRTYSNTQREEAPADSNAYFGNAQNT